MIYKQSLITASARALGVTPSDLRYLFAVVALVTTSVAETAKADSSQEAHFAAYITGYGYWDNTPPGSTAISHAVKHRRAGGTGTYHDPITLAVGHALNGPHHSMDFRPGTIFYIRRFKKYAIVEDTCGDGPRPQDGPCHTGFQGHPWIDLYVGGKDEGPQMTDRCSYALTGLQMVILNPAPNYEVVQGEMVKSGCRAF